MKKATKTTKKAAIKAAPAKKAAAEKTDALSIHVNPSGRMCFGKLAAQRIGDLEYAAVAFANGKLRIIATAKETETPIRRANGRPYISATKILKDAEIFNGAALDLIAQPVNSHGFEIARG